MKNLIIILTGTLLLPTTGRAAEPTHSLTNKQAKELILTATTPADLMRLTRYFEAEAKADEAESQEPAAIMSDNTLAPQPGYRRGNHSPGSTAGLHPSSGHGITTITGAKACLGIAPCPGTRFRGPAFAPNIKIQAEKKMLS